MLEYASTLEDGEYNQIILDAIKESNKTGKIVELEKGYKSNIWY